MDQPDSTFRTIIESSADAFWILDLEGRTIYANPQLARLYGGDQSDLDDLTVFDTLDADGREDFERHLGDLREGRINHEDVECLFVRKDGTAVWVLLRENAWLDESGAMIGVVHRISEYAERRAVYDELFESRRRLAETQQIARVGGWNWDLETNELLGTEALAGLYGMSVGDFPKDIDALLALVHPDDLQAIGESMAPIGEGGHELGFVVRFRSDPDADWMWIRARGVIVRDSKGRALRVSGTHQDVTELMLAERALEDQVTQNALLRAIATSANRARTLEDVLPHLRDLVLSHDDWSRARCFLLDDRRLVPYLASPADVAADLEDPSTAEADRDLAASAAEQRVSVWADDHLAVATPIMVMDQPAAVLLIASARPLIRHDMIQDGLESTAVQVARVLEREQGAQRLSAARDAAMEASRHKSEFLATMSHEIRTPLNGVIGLNDLLLRSELDAAQRRLASGVQVAGRALLAVLNDVLDFSKIEAGKIDLEALDFDVRAVFEQVGGVLGEGARSKGLELILSCHPDVPGVVNGDPTRLAQVITNLTSNAIKFTPTGEVFVRAVVESSDEISTVLSVEVADTGIGIAPGKVESLLEPFTQADSSTTRVYGGTGLGLAISKQIVQALGGVLSYSPNGSGGSTFRFTATFRVADTDLADDRDAEARAVLENSRVLIVDDNERNRLILVEQVARWGMHAHSVASATRAMDALTRADEKGTPFHLVLLDYAMPEQDGLELAREITARFTQPPTMVVLTSITPVDHAAFESAGVVECLTKPVPVDILRSVLLRTPDPGPKPAPDVADDTSADRRVLVVEDNEVNQMVALGVLEALGYAGESVNDGAKAVERVERGNVDAVLMDVQMPVLDGYAATRAIRLAGNRRLPIIAMTAAAVEGERDRCLAAGMDAYLTKPIDPTALAETLAEWLQEPGARTDDEDPVTNPTPPIDGLDTVRLDMLRDLDPGDTTYLDRAIGNFVTKSAAAVDSLEVAVAADDADAVRAIAHKLSGSASNLGISAAAEDSRALEMSSVSGRSEEWGPQLALLRVSVIDGCRLLLDYQATYTNESDQGEIS